MGKGKRKHTNLPRDDEPAIPLFVVICHILKGMNTLIRHLFQSAQKKKE